MIKYNDIRIDREKIHPWLNYKLKLLLKKCNKKGIYLIITEGFRSVEYQDNLYAKGRTKKGSIVTYARGKDYQSQHQWGIAFDIAINDTKLLYDVAMLKKVAKIAKSKSVGLAWGGDWVSPIDMPHFYLKKWGDTTRKLKSIYKTPEKFRREWTRTVRWTKRGLNIWNKSHTKVLRKKVPNGNDVNVMYIKGKYAKVEYLGTVGYMKVKYLNKFINL